MGLVRTNITLPEETLALVDAVAGPRGRSRYIADIVARQVRRDNARMVFEKYAGALKDSDAWGRTPEETDRLLREVRDSSDRDRMLWAPYEETVAAAALYLALAPHIRVSGAMKALLMSSPAGNAGAPGQESPPSSGPPGGAL